jgi:hypothetical protein
MVLLRGDVLLRRELLRALAESHDLTAKQWKLQETQLAFAMKMTGSLVAAVAAVF